METAMKILSCAGILPVNQDIFFDLGYLPSHMIKTPQIGEYFRTTDELRLEITEGTVHTEYASFQSNKTEAVGHNGSHIETFLNSFIIPDARKRSPQGRKRKQSKVEF
jgi:hypothetical protein